MKDKLGYSLRVLSDVVKKRKKAKKEIVLNHLKIYCKGV